MAIALVNSVITGTSAGGGTTSAIDTTGATLLVVLASYYSQSGNIPTVSDSKANTWNSLTNYNTTNSASARFFWSTPSSVGSGHTFSLSGTTVYTSIWAAAFSGVTSSSPFDAENGALSATGTSRQTGSVTPANNGSLILAGLCGNMAAGFAINSGFTIANSIAFSSGNYMGGAGAYLIQAAAAAINPTWSWTGSAGNSVNVAVFKPAAGGGSIIPLVMHLNRMRRAG